MVTPITYALSLSFVSKETQFVISAAKYGLLGGTECSADCHQGLILFLSQRKNLQRSISSMEEDKANVQKITESKYKHATGICTVKV
ncbi:hypothetical protein C0J52_15989 [Blattella germanica]|nr:hypothetical protein C0J52_15989 [Blattella germanica]